MKLEGEYLNGKKNEKFKEYSLNEKLVFEGEYLNGVKWNRKVFDIKRNYIYELKNGKIIDGESDILENLEFNNRGYIIKILLDI